MSMDEKLQLISERIDKLLGDLERVNEENKFLKSENLGLKDDYKHLEKDFSSLRLEHTDQTNSIRSKLQTVLKRLGDLEALDR